MQQTKQYQFMFGLLYPAFLGTILFNFIQRITSSIGYNDIYLSSRVSLGILCLSFFCVAFINSSNAKNYKTRAFLLDILEVLCMFMAFEALKLLSLSLEKPHLNAAYFWLFCTVLTQEIWRIVAQPPHPWFLFEIRASMAILLLVGLSLHQIFFLITPIISILCFILLYLYVFKPKWYTSVRHYILP